MWDSRVVKISMVFIIMISASCAEKEIIIPPLEVPVTGKTVLVEDLTGVRCPNCPSANARLEAIQSIYGDNLIIIGIHGNLLTKPLAESKYDFRNQDAIDLENSYTPLIGKPSAVINRKIHPEISFIANPLQDQWQPIIERELQLDQIFSIEADMIKEDDIIIANIGVLALKSFPSSAYIHLYITENNIIDVQEDVDRVVEDYEHDHVLRKAINGLEGQMLGVEFSEGSVSNITINIPASSIQDEWNKENLDFILFVTDDQGAIIEARKFKFPA